MNLKIPAVNYLKIIENKNNLGVNLVRKIYFKA